MIYDLERRFGHQFWYVPRTYGPDRRTGQVYTTGIAALCRGVAFSSDDRVVADTIRNVHDIGRFNYNQWIFLVRSKWADPSLADHFIYDGVRYEIVEKEAVEDGYILTCIKSVSMTIANEALILSETWTIEVTDA